ncbi:hypothetical protein G9C85_04205 [Halorubellus sp. JP-L1]|uniref:hypothetical protein n=1 Tax=Halorubellus sp. JP-L1 TaxID=2715753 RepID=UPI00140BC29B|nr:hypothetical protein [Halorubellus sp. JP-L1]NHN40836.1 hypothetical protein [Halorubellus sp. JP-L1]
MVSESTIRNAAGLAIIVGAFVLLYALAATGDLTPTFVASTLPLFGLGAALVVGGGVVRRYLHHLHGATSN